MRAELLIIGTELLLGEIVDTNATFLASQLAQCGIDLYYKSTVGDNLGRGKEVLDLALRRSDLVIISGGLGPTDDDLTREIVAAVTSRKLVENGPVRAELEKWFEERYGKKTPMPVHNYKQALFPQGSRILENPVGTAPGFWLEVDKKVIVALPGVPRELQAMFTESVQPLLLAKGSTESLVLRNLNFVGIGESSLEEILGDLLAEQTNPTLALYASGGQVRLRLAAKATTREAGIQLIEPIETKVKLLTKGYFYGIDGQSLEAVVAQQLVENKQTIALAESCTGGLISHRLTNVPGSSRFFERGFIVYSNQAKVEDLGVSNATLRDFGAVSAETAREMAEGVRQRSATDFGLAVTGIAGPGGGTAHKPVGLVYISLAFLGDTIVQRHLWRGTREQIKNQAALQALQLLWRSL